MKRRSVGKFAMVLVMLAWMGSIECLLAFDQSHQAFTKVLAGHVKGKQVDYAGLKAKPGELDRYLGTLAGVSEAEFRKWKKDERLAFLINLYNAATLKLVVDHYPVKSIKDIGGVFKNPWKMEVVQVFGGKRTLDQVEHEMIRPVFSEPRAHFALNCASIGCPSLRNEAYRADRLNRQMDEQGRIFMRDASKNRVDGKKGRLYLSEIFKWFEGDFTAESGTVAKFVAPFMTAADRQVVLTGGLKVTYTKYDWGLNRL